MKHFTSLDDISDLLNFMDFAAALKKTPSTHSLGKTKTLGLIFLNPSLRTRISTQKAGRSLGMDVICMDIGTEGWGLEYKKGAIMNGKAAEHIKEAAAVLGAYCDIIGIRSFAALQNREEDYAENILEGFKTYSGVPIISLESSTGHPLQAIADYMTIKEHAKKSQPKIVLTWAPHIRALPQAVPNSFAHLGYKLGAHVVIACPPGMELSKKYTGTLPLTHNQDEALKDADFVYAKNWSSFENYGHIEKGFNHWMITPEKMALTHQAKFMHCLPVRRNIVVHDAVLDSPHSIVISQALNRIHSATAVLTHLLEACS